MILCAKFHTFVPICAIVKLTALTNIYAYKELTIKHLNLVQSHHQSVLCVSNKCPSTRGVFYMGRSIEGGVYSRDI